MTLVALESLRDAAGNPLLAVSGFDDIDEAASVGAADNIRKENPGGS
ncbi:MULTISPECIES: hypothetical protein [Pantoea]|nr:MULTISPECIES: hypothetical protein [Pantoea]